MDKTAARALQLEVMEAVEAVFARHDLKPVKVRSKYGDPGLGLPPFAITIEAASTDAALDPDRIAWARYATALGLPADGLDKIVSFGLVPYRIVGFVPSRPRFPVKVKAVNGGKVMLYTVEGTKRALGVAAR